MCVCVCVCCCRERIKEAWACNMLMCAYSNLVSRLVIETVFILITVDDDDKNNNNYYYISVY